MNICMDGFRRCLRAWRETSVAGRFAGGFLLLCVILAAIPFVARLRYEVSGPYTWDTTIYWAVGRGIVNGLKPWADLFETKPPGIFLLSALSIRLTGDGSLMNICEAGALLLIAVFPPLLLLGRPDIRQRWLATLLLAMLGLLLAQYVAERAGEIQVESFGAAAGALAVFAMASPLFDRHPLWGILIGAVGWLGACGMKEPFVLPLAGAAIVLLHTRREWLLRLVTPLALAVIIGFGTLAILGWWHAYFHDYLGYMVGYSHRYGQTPWHRALDVFHIWEDMNNFCHGLGYSMWVMAGGGVAFAAFQARDFADGFAEVLRFGAAAALAALAVGLGGEYYNHHHVFALPVICACTAYLVVVMQSPWHGEGGARILVGALAVVLCYVTLSLPNLHLDDRLEGLRNARKPAIEEARYIDAVLDATHIGRYMYAGTNGPQLFAFTKHSPMGPLFFQHDDIVAGSESLRTGYLANLKTAQIVVTDHINSQLLGPTQEVLRRDFTTHPWPEIAEIQRGIPKYTIWYRKRNGQ